MAKFKPGAEWRGNQATVFREGNEHRWSPGVSGNPAGLPKARAEFEKAFYSALMGQGSAEEAAKLLWDCARAKEPWAVQLLLQRVAPQESKFKLEVSHGQDDGFDASRLSDTELEDLTRLLARAIPDAPRLEAGESETGPS